MEDRVMDFERSLLELIDFAQVVRSCNLTLLVAFISQQMLRNPQQRRQADIHDVGYRKLLIS
jgi:hypothetical protein